MNPLGLEELNLGPAILYVHEELSCYASFPLKGSNQNSYGNYPKSQLPELQAMEITKSSATGNYSGKQEMRNTKNERNDAEPKVKSSAYTEARSVQTDKEKQWSQDYNKKLELLLSDIKKSLVEPLEKNFEKYGISKDVFEKLGIGFTIPVSESAAAHFSQPDNKIYFYSDIIGSFDSKRFEEADGNDKMVMAMRELTAHELTHYARFNAMGENIDRINDVEESIANLMAGVMTSTKEKIAESYSMLNESFMSDSVSGLPYMVGYAAAYALLSLDEKERTEKINKLFFEKDQRKSIEDISNLALQSGLVKGEALNSIIKELPKIQDHIHGKNEQIPKDEIREIINSSNPYLIGLLAENSNLTKNFRKMLENSGEDFAKIILIKNQEIERDEQMVLARHSGEKVKLNLASYWGLDPDVQLELFKEASPLVLKNLASNPSISKEVQEHIAEQGDESLQLLLLKNLSGSDIDKISNSEILHNVLSNGKKTSEPSANAIKSLSESGHEKVRGVMAVAVSSEADLKEDKDTIELQMKFAEDNSALVRTMLAMGSGLSEQAFSKLLSDKEPIVLAALAENSSLKENERLQVAEELKRMGMDISDAALAQELSKYTRAFLDIQTFLL